MAKIADNTHMEQKNKSQQYAEIQAFVQKEIESQFEKLYKKYATKYGVSDTPLHVHNGIDAPNVPNSSMRDFITLPASGNGVISPDNLAGQVYTINTGDGASSDPAQVRIPQTPIIYGAGGGPLSQFMGGDAPEGTMLFFNNGVSISGLWIRSGGSWFGIGQGTAGYTNTVI